MAPAAEPGTPPRKRGRPTASSGVDTRRRILDTAQQRFGELGYRGLSVEQLARDVGVDARAIYHYFPSKGDIFSAASVDALEVFGAEVLSRVLIHDDLRTQLHAFVDMYRWLYTESRHILSFLSVVMIEGIDNARDSGTEAGGQAPTSDENVARVGEGLMALNASLVEGAVAGGELDPTVSVEAAATLLNMFGMGLGLVSLDEGRPFLAMLDALDLLIDGRLFLG